MISEEQLISEIVTFHKTSCLCSNIVQNHCKNTPWTARCNSIVLYHIICTDKHHFSIFKSRYSVYITNSNCKIYINIEFQKLYYEEYKR